ncbi:MAG: hypothetical protein N2053_04950 [Chitinispirillaceae bacterium]|nr:hypothetical protein [Chitinispirillaceae bacterium]
MGHETTLQKSEKMILGKIVRISLVLLMFFFQILYSKTREIGKPIPRRNVTIRNISYNSNGTIFSVPNFISAGSVALFWVDKEGKIASIPERFSEKNFVMSSGLFFLRKKQENEPSMAFIPLPELLSGYSVDFSKNGNIIAIAGGNSVHIYENKERFEKTKILTIGTNISRAVFSNDCSKLAVISDGNLYLFSTENYSLLYKIDASSECRFCDLAFSNDNLKVAVFEFKNVMFNYTSRIRIFYTSNGELDRDLPLPVKPSSEPLYFPVISYSPGDTSIVVSIPSGLRGKVFLIKSNDGSVIKEFKGLPHSFSPDGTLLAAGDKIYSLRDWSVVGKIPSTTVACTFSPTERVIIVVTTDSIRRFRIEE